VPRLSGCLSWERVRSRNQLIDFIGGGDAEVREACRNVVHVLGVVSVSSCQEWRGTGPEGKMGEPEENQATKRTHTISSIMARRQKRKYANVNVSAKAKINIRYRGGRSLRTTRCVHQGAAQREPSTWDRQLHSRGIPSESTPAPPQIESSREPGIWNRVRGCTRARQSVWPFHTMPMMPRHAMHDAMPSMERRGRACGYVLLPVCPIEAWPDPGVNADGRKEAKK
jgi:hypothetical protein